MMKPGDKKRLATGIVKRLRRQRFSAYFVGGCVRDMLMRKRPKDFDIATNALPAQIKKVFAQRVYPVGEEFGTLLIVRDKVPFQVSTFRKRGARYSQHLADDLLLRDFTINALAYDPIKLKIIDLVEARVDIRKKRIRTIGAPKAQFIRDPLRLIRAVRFAVTLGFKIEKETLEAVAQLSRLIKRVSAERIRRELIGVLTSPDPSGGLRLLEETRILKYILPEVGRLKGVQQPRAFHPEGDVFAHTLLMLKQLKQPSPILALASLLHDIGKPQTFQLAERIRFSGHDRVGAKISDKLLRRMKFSNKDREAIVACVENHMRMMEAPRMRDSTLKRLFARPTFQTELALHRIDCIASHKDLSIFRFLKRRFAEFQKQPRIPRPLLNGYELMKMGLTAGPIFGKILKTMVDLQLEGKLGTKTAARRWVKERWLK